MKIFTAQRKIIIFLLLFINQLISAQITKLSDIVQGKLIYYTPVYDVVNDDKKDLYGYFFLFDLGKKNKKEYLYEYMLLDKNLNKVYSKEFTEKFERNSTSKSFLGADWFKNGEIFLETYEFGVSGKKIISNSWSRIINIRNGNPSEPFYVDSVNPEYPITEGRTTTKNKLPPSFMYSFSTFGDNGLTYKSNNWPYPLCYYASAEPGNPAWCLKNSKENKQTKKKYTEYSISSVGEGIGLLNEMDMKTDKYGSVQKYLDLRYKLINLKDGSVITQLQIPELIEKKDSIMKVLKKGPWNFRVNGYIEDNHFVRNYSLKANTTMTKLYYSLQTGEQVKVNTFTRDHLSPYLQFDKENNIVENGVDKGKLEHISTYSYPGERMIMFFEEIKREKVKAEFGNFIFIELNKELQVTKFTKTDIKNRSLNRADYIKMIESENEGSKLTKSDLQTLLLEDVKITKWVDDTWLIFYRKKYEEGKLTNLSVMSYKDGKIKELPDFPLRNSEGGKISFLPAKKGYFLLYEEFNDRLPELRLEKINY